MKCVSHVIVLILLSFFSWQFSFAQEAVEAPVAGVWAHESEASAVLVGGNTETESYSLKHKSLYKYKVDSYSVFGRYINGSSQGVEISRAWDANLRYERELTGSWSVFYQHGAESDVFAGYLQRDFDDLGLKYFFIKQADEKFFSELGYRSLREHKVLNNEKVNSPSGRLYVEYDKKFSESISGKLWAEYIPNFNDAEAWLLNYEPSMSVMLNQVFSLKLAYLVKHHEKLMSVNEKKQDTTFTTSLVAKF